MKKRIKKPVIKSVEPVEEYSLFTDLDVHLFREGKHYRLYEKFGSHMVEREGISGTYFSVWAPNAEFVSVIGDFNGWDKESHALKVRWDESGIWEGWIPYTGKGDNYKYFIRSKYGNAEFEKLDPYGAYHTQPPQPCTKIQDTWYEWHDQKWMKGRGEKNKLTAPWSVYEMHIGSWRRSPDDPDKVLGFRDIADLLVPYLKHMNFTHVEFLPVMEHPFYGSWGYQITGFFASCSRYGYPQDLMFLIDELHKGTALYEHADPRKGFHPDWGSYIFNYGRNEVKSFLISNAMFWLDRYHVDGLRVDAVASMLYLDYSRKAGEWIPNEHGGRENLEAITFLKEFNTKVSKDFPDVQTIAEESTAFPKVTRPIYDDGLGFGMKWMMGWMNDTLKYFAMDPIHRKFHHNLLTFSIMYAFSENFMLPLSHDEVVHLKKSLINKMPGDEWQRFANMRCLFAYMYTHPGAKLMFMGSEFGQEHEWAHDKSLDWHLAGNAPQKGLENFMRDLNHICKTEPALYEHNFSPEGFEWIKVNDADQSVIIYMRKGIDESNVIIFGVNLTPVPRLNYRFGVPFKGQWKEILNSDDLKYHGAGDVWNNEIQSEETGADGKDHSIVLNFPPLAAVLLKPVTPVRKKASGKE
jgi:1,4-alpha-glucan branching enzyme